jgi:hypothetical protein
MYVLVTLLIALLFFFKAITDRSLPAHYLISVRARAVKAAGL